MSSIYCFMKELSGDNRAYSDCWKPWSEARLGMRIEKPTGVKDMVSACELVVNVGTIEIASEDRIDGIKHLAAGNMEIDDVAMFPVGGEVHKGKSVIDGKSKRSPMRGVKEVGVVPVDNLLRKKYRELWRRFDINEDRVLTVEAWVKGVKHNFKRDLTDDCAVELFKLIDTTGSGSISFKDFGGLLKFVRSWDISESEETMKVRIVLWNILKDEGKKYSDYDAIGLKRLRRTVEENFNLKQNVLSYGNANKTFLKLVKDFFMHS